MKDAPDLQALGHLDKHGPIINVDYLLRTYLRDIQSNSVYVCVRLAVVDKAGRDKKVYECAQFELLDTIDRKLAPLITYSCHLKAVSSLESAHQLDHLWKRLGLSVHERLELLPFERPLLIKNNPI
jgi:hypothetical protein